MSANRSLIPKALNKIARIGLRCNAIYAAAASCASKSKGGVLPSVAEARDTLLNASPRPLTGFNVEPRKWPAIQSVDISVIIPCYNSEKWIEGCVRSVAGQVCKCSFEIIAIDDGSTDATGTILDRLAVGIPNLVIIHQANRGFSGARNVGIANASGGSRICRLR